MHNLNARYRIQSIVEMMNMKKYLPFFILFLFAKGIPQSLNHPLPTANMKGVEKVIMKQYRCWASPSGRGVYKREYMRGSTETYDGFGNIIEYFGTDLEGKATNKLKYSYDTFGNQSGNTHYLLNRTTDSLEIESYLVRKWNNQNKLEKEIAHNNEHLIVRKTIKLYNSDGQITKSTTSTVEPDTYLLKFKFSDSFEYDAKGNLVNSIQEQGDETYSTSYEYDYDSRGNVKEKRVYNNSLKVDSTFICEYDRTGRLETISIFIDEIIPASLTIFQYDNTGHIDVITTLRYNKFSPTVGVQEVLFDENHRVTQMITGYANENEFLIGKKWQPDIYYKYSYEYIPYTNKQSTHTFTERYKSGEVKSITPYLDLIKQGRYTEWHENGKIKTAGFYQEGYRFGTWIQWYPNGQVEERETWNFDKQPELNTRWYENGQKSSEGYTIMNPYRLELGTHIGHSIGVWKHWYENGTIESKGSYGIAGETLHDWAHWYPDGKRKSESKLLTDSTGVYTSWFENGQMSENGNFTLSNSDEYHLEHRYFRDGKWTEWYQNGQLKAEGFYCGRGSDASKSGEWIYWNENGQSEVIHFVSMDICNEYYNNGNIRVRYTYDENMIYTELYINGDVKIVGQCKRADNYYGWSNVRHGKWVFYHENGNIAKVILYNDGVELN